VAGREAGIGPGCGGPGWLGVAGPVTVSRMWPGWPADAVPGRGRRAFYQLGWAKDATGDPAAALAAYGQALRLYQAAGDRGGEATTLKQHRRRARRPGPAAAGTGVLPAGTAVMREVGDRAGEAATLNKHRRRARGAGRAGSGRLEYHGQALPIMREVGDRAGEAATLTNIGAVHDGWASPQRALGVLPAGNCRSWREVGDGRRPGRQPR